jgi:hypothetical protein
LKICSVHTKYLDSHHLANEQCFLIFISQIKSPATVDLVPEFILSNNGIQSVNSAMPGMLGPAESAHAPEHMCDARKIHIKKQFALMLLQ